MKKSEKILIALGIIQVIISTLQLILKVLWINPIILLSFFHYLNLVHSKVVDKNDIDVNTKSNNNNYPNDFNI